MFLIYNFIFTNYTIKINIININSLNGAFTLGEFIKLTAEIVNMIHDIIQIFTEKMGWDLTDKDLHFWLIGFIGVIFFLSIHPILKALASLSFTIVSFIYTFTILIVIVFALEIQQKITGRGQMEFEDAIVGLWGFIAMFAGLMALKLLYITLMRSNTKNKREEDQSQ